ncbi:MAG: long-chain-fatty-acid--CoA ligase [bacterium]
MEVRYRNLRHMFEERAKESAGDAYVAFYDRELTFGEFDERSSRLADSLLKLGVGKGDIVYIYMNNSPEYVIAAAAITKLGAVAGPTNSWLKSGEIRYQYNDSKGKAVIVDTEFLPVVEEIAPGCPALKHIIVNADAQKEGHFSMPGLIAEGSPRLADAEIARNDLAFIFYTAGTTGNPKGALQTHWNVVFELEAIRQALEIPGETPGDTVALIFLPFFHVNAMMSMMAGVYRGIKTVVLKKFSVREFGPAVEKHRAAFFSAVPKVYKILIEARDTVQKHDLSSLKFGICGAAPMPVETIRRFEELYGVEILEGYGLTEGTVASTLHRRGGKKKIGSIGQALPGQEVKILDANDRELPAGEVGEICVRGDNVMVGYLGLDEVNRQTLRGGWLHTGDRGCVDEEGFFYIVDREKDMIIKGGENIYPKEIENVISTHTDVYDVAVIGVPDEMSGEEVKAFVVPRIGREMSEEQIIEHCRASLADFKVPRYVEFVIGLPSSAVGKALKRLLREGKGITRISDLGGETLNLDPIFQMMPFRFNAAKAGAWRTDTVLRVRSRRRDVDDGRRRREDGSAQGRG